MDTENKPAVELAFDEFAALIREKDEAGITFSAFLKQLQAEADRANRRLELAKTAADACSATKTRKQRSDRGKKRVRVVKVESVAVPATSAPA